MKYRACTDCNGRALPVITTEWGATVCGHCRKGDFLAGPEMTKERADDFNASLQPVVQRREPASRVVRAEASSSDWSRYDSSLYASTYDSDSSDGMSDWGIEYIEGPPLATMMSKEDIVSSPLQRVLLQDSQIWKLPFTLPFPTITKNQAAYIDMDEYLWPQYTRAGTHHHPSRAGRGHRPGGLQEHSGQGRWYPSAKLLA